MNKLMGTKQKLNNADFSKRLFSFLIVMMMLGNVYLFPFFKSIDMGEVLLIIFVPYFLAKMSFILIPKRDGWIYLFLWYALLLTFLMSGILGGNFSDSLERLGRDFFYYFLIFFLGVHFFDMESFKKILINFCLALSGLVILQVIVYTFTGYLIPGFFMNAYLNDGGYVGYQLYAHYLRYASIAGYLKPNGFLCEPAHCAQCFFVGLLVLLFDRKKDRKDMNKALFISLGMLLTMSTSGLLYLFFSWFFWAMKEAKRNVIKIFILVAGISAIAIFLISNGYLSNIGRVLYRFTSVISGDPTTNSTQLRMIKGFLTFFALPTGIKVFGIGFGNYSALVTSVLQGVDIGLIESEYMNTIAYLLMSTGIIGFLILVIFFGSVYKKGQPLTQMMILALVVMGLGASIYSSPIWVWLMLLILYSKREEILENGRYSYT